MTGTPALADDLGIQPAGAVPGIPPSAQTISIRKSPQFPGNNINLTKPINTLQPIPPAASQLPSPLN